MRYARLLQRLAPLVLLVSITGTASAQAIRNNAGFNTNELARNDDGSTGLVNLGLTANFFGLSRTQAYVNNNGNITFDNSLSTYTPFPLSTTSRQIIAPFFADIDTRNALSNTTRYGTDVIGGRNAFGVNWLGVGYFPSMADKLLDAQLVLIDRSDISAGDFDFEFNFGRVQFEVGGASGDSNENGLCEPSETSCVPVRVGWSNGNAATFELTGSATPGAFIDGGPRALISNNLNSNVNGRYLFQVRNGQVVSTVPEPATIALTALGLACTAVVARRRRVRG